MHSAVVIKGRTKVNTLRFCSVCVCVCVCVCGGGGGGGGGGGRYLDTYLISSNFHINVTSFD